MENENMRENENTVETPDAFDEAKNELTDGAEENSVFDEAVDKNAIAEEIAAEASKESEECDSCNACDASDSEAFDEEAFGGACGENESFDEEGAEFDEEYDAETAMLLENIENAKKSKKKLKTILGAVLVVIAAIVVYCVCSVNGVGSRTVVGNPIPVEEGTAVSTIKYENPIMSIFDSVALGKNNRSVMKINGEVVDSGVFSFVANSAAVNSLYSLYSDGKLENPAEFDWNTIEEKSGLTYREYAKGEAVNTLVPIYALVAEGRKRGVTLSEDEEKQLTDWIEQLKSQYGTEFENALKQSGYADEKALLEVQRIQMYMQKVYSDLQSDISKYANADDMKGYLSDDKITVKHILIMPEEENEESKNAAKAKAEEVLAKVKAGEDFDALIEKYNEDPGSTDAGYTFAQDGSMVKEFEEAAFKLEVGETSDIVETSYGYHIIKRIERGISIDEYMDMLVDTAKVRLKKGAYNKTDITIDPKELFGGLDATADAEAESTEK